MENKNELLSTMYVLYNLTCHEIEDFYFNKNMYYEELKRSFMYNGIKYDIALETSARSTVITLNSGGTGIAIFSNHAHIISEGNQRKILTDAEVIDRISEDESTVSLYKDNLVSSGKVTKVQDFDKSELFNLSLINNNSCVYGYEFLYKLYPSIKFKFCVLRFENLNDIFNKNKPTFISCTI